jgi:hypothetical protein
MPFLAALAPLIGIGTAAGGATTAASVLGALGTLGGLAGAGTTIGETIANSGGPGTPATPTTPTPIPPNPQQLLAQRAAVSQQLPNVLSQTSGLASPGYDSLIAQILAGVTGQPGANAAGAAATGQQFSVANSQPTNAAVTGQTDLSNFVNSSI